MSLLLLPVLITNVHSAELGNALGLPIQIEEADIRIRVGDAEGAPGEIIDVPVSLERTSLELWRLRIVYRENLVINQLLLIS